MCRGGGTGVACPIVRTTLPERRGEATRGGNDGRTDLGQLPDLRVLRPPRRARPARDHEGGLRSQGDQHGGPRSGGPPDVRRAPWAGRGGRQGAARAGRLRPVAAGVTPVPPALVLKVGRQATKAASPPSLSRRKAAAGSIGQLVGPCESPAQ